MTAQELKTFLTTHGLQLKLRPEPRVRESIESAVAKYCEAQGAK